MKLDKYQKKVVNCNRNAVVSAGAGSGKTTVLAARFLRLVEEGKAGVSEVLTLTFTRKAAAEMYERIYGILLKHRGTPAVDRAVSEFDKAAISTLDSFCSSIARNCCGLFGVSPGFKTDEDAVRELADETSLDYILENSENPFLKEFISINGFENVWKNYFNHISMTYLALGRPVDFNLVFESQMRTAADELKRLSAEADRIISGLNGLEPVSKGIASVHQNLSGIPLFGGLAEAGNFKQISEIFSSLKVDKPRGRPKDPAVLERVNTCKELIDQLRSVSDSVFEITETLGNRELIEGLFLLTSDFQERLFSRKRTTGLLGFQDVLTIAVSGLKQDKQLRSYYKGLFRYIMIDEFQDNNSLQKELLYLLSERDGIENDEIPSAAELDPEKLFFVGDEKQSIYMFRGADVSVFKQLSGELTACGGEALTLKRNYRSEPGLISFFNDVFREVMHDSTEDYQAAFEPLESREQALQEGSDIRLLYKPYLGTLPEDALSAEESEAREIADYILENEGRLEISVKGVSRRACFSDFALLFRSGTNQKTYESVFREKGIPYTVQSVRSLFQEAPVNDVYNIIQLCIYPGDRLASAALLRSPLASLSDDSVIRLLLSDGAVLGDGKEELCCSDRDRNRYLRLKKFYKAILGKIDSEPLEKVVSDIVLESGYRYLLLSDISLHGYLEHFDYLEKLAARFDAQKKTAAEFLDYLRENLGEYHKIDNLKIFGYKSGGVSIMPIHQSKGLEFPVVIMVNAGNTGMNDRGGSAPAFISARDGLSFNLIRNGGGGYSSKKRSNFFYSRGREESKAREEAELRRLLYVALTRAENHLVISGCHGKMNRTGSRSMLNMFLRAFGWEDGTEPADCPEIKPYLRIITDRKWNEAAAGRRMLRHVNPADAGRIYSAADVLSFSAPRVEYAASGLNAEVLEALEADGEEEVVMPELGKRTEKLLTDEKLEADFGTLCHRVIEWTIKGIIAPSVVGAGPETGKIELSSEAETDLLYPFIRLSEADRRLILKEALTLAGRFFNSDLWKKAEDSGSFESELAFTSLRKRDGREIYVNGVIDLLFEAEDEIQIVDFKTDRKIKPGEYDLQMQIYRDAASEIYGKPASSSLFYLRGGEEVISGV